MLMFFVALGAGAPLVQRGPGAFIGYSLALAAVLMGVCYWKGEKPHWSWGKRE